MKTRLVLVVLYLLGATACSEHYSETWCPSSHAVDDNDSCVGAPSCSYVDDPNADMEQYGFDDVQVCDSMVTNLKLVFCGDEKTRPSHNLCAAAPGKIGAWCCIPTN